MPDDKKAILRGPLSFLNQSTDVELWNESVRQICDARGVPVCKALLEKEKPDPLIRATEEEESTLEKRRSDKREFWLKKLKAGSELDWDEAVRRIAARDPRSGDFLRDLVKRARESGVL